MRALTLAVAVAAAAPATAAAHEPEFFVLTGVDFRTADHADLAALAGQTRYGRADDLSPGALGLLVGLGLQPLALLDVAAQASIAVGGLAIGAVEQRYFGGVESIGSTIALQAGASARAAPALGPDLRLLVGGGAMWHRLNVASPAGGARLTSVALGPEVGLRWRVTRVGARVDGYLQVVLDARAHLPTYVAVSRSSTDVLFRTGSPASDPFYSGGLSASWVFGFR